MAFHPLARTVGNLVVWLRWSAYSRLMHLTFEHRDWNYGCCVAGALTLHRDGKKPIRRAAHVWVKNDDYEAAAVGVEAFLRKKMRRKIKRYSR